MEELGIGRPSTYASILQVLKDRKYVRLDKKRLVSGGQGPHRRRLPGKLLRHATSSTISPPASRSSSTSISNNEVAWRDVLRDFWRDFIGAVDEIKELKNLRR